MTLQELIDAVILKATGKAAILEPNNAKWLKICGIANTYLKAWQNEPNVAWQSLYERAREIGTISSSDEYELDDDIATISTARGDSVYILAKNGEKISYELVPYNDLKNHKYGEYCAKIGQTLVFNGGGFKAEDTEYGGRIYAPIYRNVETVENAEDEIEIDDPMWLVFMCAAEYIRNDIVKQNQYGNLVAEANNLMSGMIQRNRSGEVRKVRGAWRNAGGIN